MVSDRVTVDAELSCHLLQRCTFQVTLDRLIDLLRLQSRLLLLDRWDGSTGRFVTP
jgi:hypothetical protein